MFRKPLFIFIGLLLMTAILAISTFAQSSVPLPSSLNSRGVIELLSNGNFDTDVDGDKLPDGWIGKKTTNAKSDKLKCDTIGSLVAHSAPCAFMFRGNPTGGASRIAQTIADTSGIVDGAAATLSVYLDARNAVSGAKLAVVQIAYSDGTSTILTLTIPAARAVGDYAQISYTKVIDIPNGATITSAKVTFQYNGKTGKFFIDDASLVMSVADPTATPTLTATETETPTATFTPTATKTPGPDLVASDGAASDWFGQAVAISGDTAVVGAYHDDIDGKIDQGSVYVFVRSGSVWTQQAKLTADDGVADDEFGDAVAIDGDTIVVGAYRDDTGANTNQGSAYIFVRSGSVWTQQTKLTASDGAANDVFGYAVAVDGDTVVIGAVDNTILGNGIQGSAYVFVRSGTVWSEQKQLIADNGLASDRLGNAVSIEGNTVVVGASEADVSGNTNQGSVYVFTRSGIAWTQQQQLIASDGAADDRFGGSVGINGDSIVIGAFGDDAAKGAVYTFTRSGVTWGSEQKLTALDGTGGDLFGLSTAISGNNIIAGAFGDNNSRGAAYLISRPCPTCLLQQKLTADDGQANDQFGYPVAVDGDTVVVGASRDTVGGNVQQGSASVFDLVP